jgi:mRNA interferase MazF
MRRGDIYLVDFDPTRGSEANKRRPAIIVSNDVANSTATTLGSGVVTVVPVTSNVEHVYPFQVFLPAADTGLGRDSKAQAEQLRSVYVDRLIKQRGELPTHLMHELDRAIRLHLAL